MISCCQTLLSTCNLRHYSTAVGPDGALYVAVDRSYPAPGGNCKAKAPPRVPGVPRGYHHPPRRHLLGVNDHKPALNLLMNMVVNDQMTKWWMVYTAAGIN